MESAQLVREMNTALEIKTGRQTSSGSNDSCVYPWFKKAEAYSNCYITKTKCWLHDATKIQHSSLFSVITNACYYT